ncbi:hypothetical protein Bca101_077230 [Brassica carinata]
MASVIDLSRIPYIRGRLHATNNQFQRYGPKGFMEIKVLHNDNLYVRVDLPGVPDDAIRYRVDAVRQKVVFFSGEETPSAGDKVDDVREYSGTAGLGCDCCEITGVEAKMKDGVLRMILSKGQGKSGRYDIGNSAIDMVEVEDHPFVVKGRKGTFTSARTSDGCYHLSVDLPGVSSDDIFVLPNENEFKFIAENKSVYEHDESCRIFIGAVNKRTCCSHGIPLLDHNIAWDAEFGVLKVRVSPPPLNNNDHYVLWEFQDNPVVIEGDMFRFRAHSKSLKLTVAAHELYNKYNESLSNVLDGDLIVLSGPGRTGGAKQRESKYCDEISVYEATFVLLGPEPNRESGVEAY